MEPNTKIVLVGKKIKSEIWKIVAEPEGATVDPEKATAEPEGATAEPERATAEPEGAISEPNLTTLYNSAEKWKEEKELAKANFSPTPKMIIWW